MERQNIHKYLKSYEPVINILNDSVVNCDNIIFNDYVDIKRKVSFVHMIKLSFEFLRLFVFENLENKIILNKYMNIFIRYMKLNFG